jgi:hypothetical protein
MSDFLQAIFRQFARVMNWRLVRNLAELQLLTRASYVTLIVVPLLAGLWPTVRLVVNQHNKAVGEAAAIFDKATIRFEQAEHQIGLRVPVSQPGGLVQAADASGSLLGERTRKEASAVLDELKQSVSQYRSDYANKSIESPSMPRTFAAAFFAALATVLAHTIYQMGAPEPVRKMTLDQFIAAKKDDYSKHPTPTALEAAQAIMERERSKHTHDYYFRQKRLMEKVLSGLDARSAARSLTRSEQIELQLMRDQREFTEDDEKRIEEVLEIAARERNDEGLGEFRRQQDMAVVAQAAERSYLNAAGNAPLMIILTALIYGVGLYLICSILVNQTASVMSSAGINSLSGIFEWWKPNG